MTRRNFCLVFFFLISTSSIANHNKDLIQGRNERHIASEASSLLSSWRQGLMFAAVIAAVVLADDLWVMLGIEEPAYPVDDY